MFDRLVILDGARDYMRIGLARLKSPAFGSLYIGKKGQRLDHVAPHLFLCDRQGVVEHLTLSGEKPDEVGILCETRVAFPKVYKHFRRFLTVERQRDGRRVLFRFYDPRVLRTFLPVCTRLELDQFFGPVETFRCQGDDPGLILSFSRDKKGKLVSEETSFDDHIYERFGVRPSEVEPVVLSPPPPPLPKPTDPSLARMQTMMLNPMDQSVPVIPRQTK